MIKTVQEIKVGLCFESAIQPVGRLVIKDYIIYFEFDDLFLESGIEISPFKLRAKGGVISLPLRPFEGLARVFNDSLPDRICIRFNGTRSRSIYPRKPLIPF